MVLTKNSPTQIASLLILLSLLLVSCGGGSGGGGGAIPCSRFDVGDNCGGGIYAGEFSSHSLVVTPGNCDDEVTPTCDNALDTLTKQWASGAATISGATNPNNGQTNTTTIINHYDSLAGNSPRAADFCNTLVYGGFSDWYLPSTNELLHLYDERASIPGLNTSGGVSYWSSTEHNDGLAVAINFTNGVSSNSSKSNNHRVRCMRRSL